MRRRKQGRRLLPVPATLTTTGVNSVIGGAGPGLLALAATGSPLGIVAGATAPWLSTGISALYDGVRGRRLGDSLGWKWSLRAILWWIAKASERSSSRRANR